MDKPWLSATEAAAYLSLPSVKALYERCRRGGVPFYRFGRRSLRFKREDLDQVLESGRQNMPDAWLDELEDLFCK